MKSSKLGWMNRLTQFYRQGKDWKWAYNRHDRLKLVLLNYYIFTISEIKDISRIISNLKKIIALAIECICIVISRILIAIVTGRFRLSVNRLFYYYDKKDDAFVDVVYYKHARKHACTHTAWASSGWYPVLRVACVRAYARALYYIFFFLISSAASISCAFLSLCGSWNFHIFFSARAFFLPLNL